MILGGALGPIQKHLAAFIVLYGTLRFCSSFPVLKPRAEDCFCPPRRQHQVSRRSSYPEKSILCVHSLCVRSQMKQPGRVLCEQFLRLLWQVGSVQSCVWLTDWSAAWGKASAAVG